MKKWLRLSAVVPVVCLLAALALSFPINAGADKTKDEIWLIQTIVKSFEATAVENGYDVSYDEDMDAVIFIWTFPATDQEWELGYDAAEVEEGFEEIYSTISAMFDGLAEDGVDVYFVVYSKDASLLHLCVNGDNLTALALSGER